MTDATRPLVARRLGRHLALGAGALLAWIALYIALRPLAAWFTYGLAGLRAGSRLGSAVEFFVFESPKVLLLLVLVVFGVDGVLKVTGRIPRAEEVREWLK